MFENRLSVMENETYTLKYTRSIHLACMFDLFEKSRIKMTKHAFRRHRITVVLLCMFQIPLPVRDFGDWDSAEGSHLHGLLKSIEK